MRVHVCPPEHTLTHTLSGPPSLGTCGVTGVLAPPSEVTTPRLLLCSCCFRSEAAALISVLQGPGGQQQTAVLSLAAAEGERDSTSSVLRRETLST